MLGMSPTGGAATAASGKGIKFRPEEPHEITALEDNTRIRNVRGPI